MTDPQYPAGPPNAGQQYSGPPYSGAPNPGAGYPGGYPGPGPAYDPVTGLPYSDKSKVAAGLLQIFLGGFGVGRFYTGHTQKAVWQLIVTLVTCGLGSIWGLIDGILILVNGDTDAQGRPLHP